MHLCTIATVIVHICMITLVLYNNSLLFFLSHWSDSLSFPTPQQPISRRKMKKIEEEKRRGEPPHYQPSTTQPPLQPNHRPSNPFQQLIIYHKINKKSNQNIKKPNSKSRKTRIHKNPLESPTKKQSKPVGLAIADVGSVIVATIGSSVATTAVVCECWVWAMREEESWGRSGVDVR